MAATLAIFAALQVAMPLWIRPHFVPPDRTVISINSPGYLAGEPGPNGGTFTFVATSLPGHLRRAVDSAK